MKKNNFTNFLTAPRPMMIVALGFFTAGLLPAQSQSFQIAEEEAAVISIDGGSTLHDWTVTCDVIKDFPSDLSLTISEDGQVESFGFSVIVENMDGHRGPIMNNKIKNAFKADEHPQITYRQTEPAAITSVDSDGGFTLVSTGILQMGGVEKEISVEVSGEMKDGQLIFSGSKPLKMTDFQIDPPSAMFGQIQTHDEVTVNFTFRYTAL